MEISIGISFKKLNFKVLHDLVLLFGTHLKEIKSVFGKIAFILLCIASYAHSQDTETLFIGCEKKETSDYVGLYTIFYSVFKIEEVTQLVTT